MIFGAIETSTWLLVGAITVMCSVLASWAIRLVVRSRVHSEPSTWSETTGTIVRSGASVNGPVRVGRGDDERPWRLARTRPKPEVIYAYSVDGHVYQGTRVRIGDNGQPVGPSSGAVTTAERYPAGTTVTVYFDPVNPWDATLER